jgi:hypothetical protein
MRVIIAGSRKGADWSDVVSAVASSEFYKMTTIVSGTARGVDQLGEDFAQEYDINLVRYPAQWDVHGKSAGYKRNELMAQNADALIAIWDGNSRGTKHMIDIAHRYNLIVYVHYLAPKKETT